MSVIAEQIANLIRDDIQQKVAKILTSKMDLPTVAEDYPTDELSREVAHCLKDELSADVIAEEVAGDYPIDELRDEVALTVAPTLDEELICTRVSCALDRLKIEREVADLLAEVVAEGVAQQIVDDKPELLTKAQTAVADILSAEIEDELTEQGIGYDARAASD